MLIVKWSKAIWTERNQSHKHAAAYRGTYTEDASSWHFIVTAMRTREVSSSLKKPKPCRINTQCDIG